VEVAVAVVVFALGAAAVLGTLGSAVRTVVLPRGVPARLGSLVFVVVGRLFRLRLGRSATWQRRDAVMAGLAPTALLTLVVVWLTITQLGYTAMFWALGAHPPQEAFTHSVSSLTTLGFSQPGDLPSVVLAFTEAGIGLTLLAMLITYLPSLYAAFAKREAAVALLEVRADSPPFGAAMLERYARIGWLGGLTAIWDQWETWFVEVEESHTSFAALVYFRSPQPDHSWITAAGGRARRRRPVGLHPAGPQPRRRALRARRLRRPPPDRRVLRHSLRPRAPARRPDQRGSRGVRRCVRPPGRRRV